MLRREEIREKLERAGLSGLEDRIMEGIELLKKQAGYIGLQAGYI